MKRKGDREMDYRLKAMHKKKGEKQKLKKDVIKFLEYMERKMELPDKEKELIRQIKGLENE